VTPHANFAVHEASQVGEARRQAARLADTLGFDDVAKGRLALVVTELGNNLVKHARDGRLVVGERRGPEAEGSIDVLSLDHGPGMADVEACLADGYTSGSTPGTGLGAVRRLAGEFHYFSKAGHGTVILARMHARTGLAAAARPARDAAEASAFVCGAVCVAAPGEVVSGDSWAWCEDGVRATLLVADGLGHGPEAAAAADEASRVLERHPGLAPNEVLTRAHAALGSTRGAAMAVFALDRSAALVTLCGAGNITARLISGVSDRTLLTQHGTAGLQIRRPQETRNEWPDHALLIAHSDGIKSRWNFKEVPALIQSDVTVIAGWLMRAHSRGRDDATVVVVRRR
jgi:anti-sigma regulatory factor (Ser/Thr protein kinase)